MEFFIRKGSDLPLLLMEVVDDGRNDYDRLYEFLESSVVSFTMKNAETDRVVVNCDKKNAGFMVVPSNGDPCKNTVLMYFKFDKNKTTKNEGTFIGTFKITNPTTGESFIVPVRENLYIHIL